MIRLMPIREHLDVIAVGQAILFGGVLQNFVHCVLASIWYVAVEKRLLTLATILLFLKTLKKCNETVSELLSGK